MTAAEASDEILRIVTDELPKVKTVVSDSICGAGRVIVKATKRDRILSRKLSMEIARLMRIVEAK